MSQIVQHNKEQRLTLASVVFGVLAIASIVLLGNSSFAFGDIQIDISKNADTQGCEINESCYSETGLVINVGQEVTWYNAGNKVHSIVSGSAEVGHYGLFDSGKILPKENFSQVFSKSGQYFYYCQTHPWMTGIVMVK